MDIEHRLADLGLDLPPAISAPPGTEIPFSWVRVIGDRARVSARRATLAMLASLQAALGDLDRISAWVVVNGFVNADPGYARTTLVMNPCSELLLELFGLDAGPNARTAIGVAALPFDLPVVISAEVALHP
jgi:enamine deaminase RidA (YjgF/YER057c/UK114 family)